MGNASGISRGNRNARLARLRALVPFENATVGMLTAVPTITFGR